ncbi:MAG: hypothetical protein SGJ13_11920 [Actinomycetota bacterium]|nr:hypothetical protein [Actinomycetota bacterium]
MAKAISVRLDDETERALRAVDEADRAEMLSVAALMESMRASR